MTDLCALATKYGTDKWNAHHYTPHYHRLFKDRRNEVKKVLEIGIGDLTMVNPTGAPYVPGASLRMWEEYFPNAEIYALDINPKLLINRGRIHSTFCDQSNIEYLSAVIPWLGKDFDLIVDDGSHLPKDQILTVKTLAPLLAPGGIYVIEDCWIYPVHVCHGDTPGINPLEIPYDWRVILCSEPAVQGLGDDRLIVIRV